MCASPVPASPSSIVQRKRQRQLPSAVPGRFMRCSLARPSTSCSGNSASFATLWLVARISAQWMRAASLQARYSAAKARTSGRALSHQPRAVSLSCVLL